MIKINATIKGLITGAAMIGMSLIIFKTKNNFDNNLQYITYALYIAGIIWTLVDYHRSETQKRSFFNYFSEGFKCFIVITLLMVMFTYIFLQTHPAIKEEMATLYRADLVAKGNTTPAEIDTNVQKAKDNFTIALTSMAVFGYLIIGALITAITSAVIYSRNSYTKK